MFESLSIFLEESKHIWSVISLFASYCLTLIYNKLNSMQILVFCHLWSVQGQTRMNDVTVDFFTSLLYIETNRLHVAMHLFTKISHLWCQNVVKTKKWHMSHWGNVSLMFLPHFNIFCDLLLIGSLGVREYILSHFSPLNSEEKVSQPLELYWFQNHGSILGIHGFSLIMTQEPI